MTLLVPEASQVQMMTKVLDQTSLTLKLFSNDHTPALGDLLANYTEVAGGGYADIDLDFANWDLAGGEPGVALYNTFCDFNFTGATSGPGTIYGYYVVDADGLLLWAERFPDDDVPFEPINGSLIRIVPRFTLGNTVV